MRTLTAVVFASAVSLSITQAGAASTTKSEQPHQDGQRVPGGISQIHQNQMFDGIELTEQQRQQMRDLMQQARHERPAISLQEIENLHELTIADQFNESALRAEAEKIAQAQVDHQVEMARVSNQMYHLLTTAQQATLQKNYERRLNQLRELSSLQSASSLQAVSSTSGNQ
ncbi:MULTISPECIES: cell-envelope stress modulator CpxP [Pantoea]|uniref:Cell-envelope stress modulator CpxP n=1 Tax=Candidatus Pantoea multigeneris TaxID=2608357 RepID=A0ABX0RKJ6_9GAMM|nr:MULTISPECIES: cell-envelope stress modulator CpxP [Pantoea]NIF24129.1 cell-envelope stress modulator CpxP [Pantoea multigeneris]